MIPKSFILDCYKSNPSYFYRDIKRKYPDEYKNLEVFYGSSVAGLYVLVYGEDVRKCKTCGNHTKFKTFRDGFFEYCSHVCYVKNEVPKEKRKKTTLQRFGVENSHQSEIVKNKFKKTMQEKYGVNNALENKILLNKVVIANDKIKHQAAEKRKNTNLARYGFTTANQTKAIKEKLKKTNIDKIGFTSPLQQPNVIQISKNKRKRDFFERLIKRSSELNLKPLFSIDEFIGVQNKHSWECINCKNIFKHHMDDGKLPLCPKCYPIYDNAPRGESELRDFISSLIPIKTNCHNIIPPKEIDIFVPDKLTAFEYNGIYWHSENKVGKNYHLEKTKQCEQKNIRLIHIFENEWLFKREIVKSRIKSILGIIETKIYARKCTIKEISYSDYIIFMEENHIQGACPAKYVYGLYFNEEIVAIMSFGKNRYNKKPGYELLRYCNKLNTIVVGGASKLFSHFVKTINPSSVASYSDKRWNSGSVYIQLGFVYSHSSSPNYFYSKDGINIKSRLEYQKHKLKHKLSFFDEKLSEIENMELNGYKRIFDCGNDVFIWEKQK